MKLSLKLKHFITLLSFPLFNREDKKEDIIVNNKRNRNIPLIIILLVVAYG